MQITITDEMAERAARAIRKHLIACDPDHTPGEYPSLNEPMDPREIAIARAALEAGISPSP